MADPAAALATQLANIEKKTGRSLADLIALVQTRPDAKHAELRDWLKAELGLGHGDANTLAHVARGAAPAPAVPVPAAGQPAPEVAGPDPLDEIYAGPKAALRPIHDRLLAELRQFGEFELAPKKGYVSLRRKKQFAMVGPATKTQVELGLNHKALAGGPRLVAQAPGGMCQYKVRLASPAEVDAELLGWVRAAFDAAG